MRHKGKERKKERKTKDPDNLEREREREMDRNRHTEDPRARETYSSPVRVRSWPAPSVDFSFLLLLPMMTGDSGPDLTSCCTEDQSKEKKKKKERKKKERRKTGSFTQSDVTDCRPGQVTHDYFPNY